MTPKMILNWTGMQSVIIHTIDKNEGKATWKQIKEAVLEEGWKPCDWMTQVRGPLQGLIDEKIVKRIDHETQSETYELAIKIY